MLSAEGANLDGKAAKESHGADRDVPYVDCCPRVVIRTCAVCWGNTSRLGKGLWKRFSRFDAGRAASKTAGLHASYPEDSQRFRSRMDIVPLRIELDPCGLMDKLQALPCGHYITEHLPNETYTLLRDFSSR